MPTTRAPRPLLLALAAALSLPVFLFQAREPVSWAAEGKDAPAAAARKFYSEGLHGVDLSGLDEAQRALALKVLNDSPCNCGCGMTVAQCRVEDQNCPRSPRLAQAIVDAVRRGGSEEEVRAAYRQAVGQASAPPAAASVSISAIAFDLSGAPIRGESAAPVTIVEFSDFQCPYCRSAQETLSQVLAAYPGKVKLAFKHLPGAGHADAMPAARAAEAARQLGKFWEMHDLLFRNAQALDAESLARYAREIGLDAERFRAAMDSAQTSAAIERDAAEAQRAGVAGTPTFFVNGQRLRNYQMQTFRGAIQRALGAASPSQ